MKAFLGSFMVALIAITVFVLMHAEEIDARPRMKYTGTNSRVMYKLDTLHIQLDSLLQVYKRVDSTFTKILEAR